MYIVIVALSDSSDTPTPIQGFGNLCIKPQGSSCPSAEETELFYTAQCQGTSAKFTLSSNGVLRQHCSKKKRKKKICPKGGQGGYGVPLVISRNCDENQSKFERTPGKLAFKKTVGRSVSRSIGRSVGQSD